MDREQLLHQFIQSWLKREKNLWQEDGMALASHELHTRTKSGRIYRKTAAAKTSNCRQGVLIKHEHMAKGKGQHCVRASRILPGVRGERAVWWSVYEPCGRSSSRMTSEIALIQRRSAFFEIVK
jgi:hypothetical protein